MPTSPPSLSIKDWFDQIQSALRVSVDHTNEVITKTPAIQEWLATAAVEAAASLADLSDVTAQMQSYRKLMDAFHDQFPELFDAVQKATNGEARLTIDWRPMTPNLSKIELEFAVEEDIDLFFRLHQDIASTVSSYLEDMNDYLPKADAFQGHPHQVGAIITNSDATVTAVLEKATKQDGSTIKTYSLKAPSYQKETALSRKQAETALIQFFREHG